MTGADPGIGEDRTFRLDRIADARTLPGSFEPPAGFDPAQHVLSGLAKTPYRHEVTLNIQGTIEQIRARLPASVATVEELPAASGADPQTERWFRVELHAERLDWLPPLLASLDRPFAVERPDELRELIAALASRLATSAQPIPPGKRGLADPTVHAHLSGTTERHQAVSAAPRLAAQITHSGAGRMARPTPRLAFN